MKERFQETADRNAISSGAVCACACCLAGDSVVRFRRLEVRRITVKGQRNGALVFITCQPGRFALRPAPCERISRTDPPALRLNPGALDSANDVRCCHLSQSHPTFLWNRFPSLDVGFACSTKIFRVLSVWITHAGPARFENRTLTVKTISLGEILTAQLPI